jgi:hypothetical protein
VVTGIGGDEMAALTLDELIRPALGTGRPPMPWTGERTAALQDAYEEGIAPASVMRAADGTAPRRRRCVGVVPWRQPASQPRTWYIGRQAGRAGSAPLRVKMCPNSGHEPNAKYPKPN